MLQVPEVLVLSSKGNGSMGLGFHPRHPNLLLIKNCFLWLWLLEYGVLNDPGVMCYFDVTMKLLFTS